jgi:hypothetical protein
LSLLGHSAIRQESSRLLFRTPEYCLPQVGRYGNTPRRTAYLLCCLVCGLVLSELGCLSGGTTRKASSTKFAKHIASSVPELSSRNRSLLAIYSAEVETTADEIILNSPSPVTRRQALEWKAEAIPVMQTSLLNTDPVAAVLDTWTFLFQMSAYMDGPSVKFALGEFHPVVAETMRNMNAEMERIVRQGAPTANIADLSQKASAWAQAHPIRASLAGRQSLDPDLIKKVGQSDLGTRASVKAVGESLGDLTARLDSYNTYAPKQARWQAELLLTDLRRDPQVSGAMSNLMVLSNAAAKASSNVDRMPELLRQTSQALNAGLEGQRLSTQAFLREERLETLDELQRQRLDTIAAMRGERLAATADIRVERQVVLDAIRNDESVALADVSTLVEKATKDLDAHGRGLIDHFFRRALQLMLLFLSLFSLVAWILLRSVRKAQTQREKLFDRAA